MQAPRHISGCPHRSSRNPHGARAQEVSDPIEIDDGIGCEVEGSVGIAGDGQCVRVPDVV
jgi:hypothetical protein